MAISLGTTNLEPQLSSGGMIVKVAQLAKEQQEAEGEIALQLIEATNPAPVGNSGQNINVKA
ncbi:cytoplasmic protein [Shewanella psychropiezotolerans]|uniref:Cytoplasmic protein n=1 Tax=Shewanella psychropiezotolerans TaxID=2593655 RepID=A0ABX5X2V0_9GAMM|nr:MULTISPECIES: cytoplasmic protein [Shewanella]MPY23622.1 cytoplasmic protein [Shewanella sp. YLB-07]QDO85677.1 cytoplasmic protein [Shewanella psychropiezotolerans]